MEVVLRPRELPLPGKNHGLRVEAPDQVKDGLAYVWSSWSNGQDQLHTIPIPAASTTNPSYVTSFTQFSGTFPPTQASLQKRLLF